MAEATYCGTVYPWQCDHVGHMNIMWYVGKFDEANWNLFARIGLTPTYLRESNRGMAAVQQNITYKRELLAGDIVEIRSMLLEIREKSIRFRARDAQRRDRRDRGDSARSPAFTWTARRARPPRSRTRSAARRWPSRRRARDRLRRPM